MAHRDMMRRMSEVFESIYDAADDALKRIAGAIWGESKEKLEFLSR
jgi:hypothetical protein